MPKAGPLPGGPSSPATPSQQGGGCHAGSITILYADRVPEIAPEAQCDRPAWPILAGVVVRIVEVDLALIDGGEHPIT